MKKEVNIMIIERDVHTSSYIKDFLTGKGYNTSAFTDFAEALKQLENFCFDIVISEMECLNLTDKIRTKMMDISFIILHYDLSADSIKKAFLYNADDYFVKPINLQNLSDRIQLIIDRKKSLEKRVLQSSSSYTYNVTNKSLTRTRLNSST